MVLDMRDLCIIDQPEMLADFCNNMRAMAVPWLAFDTEFIRERTYYPQLCLIQVAVPGQLVCIDPLTLPSLDPLITILYDQSVPKIAHAVHQDLEIFFHLFGAVPGPIFDTQLAALLLGMGSQIGYAALVRQQLGVTLTKAYTRVNWCQRPLASEWLDYAADDVRYLGEIYIRQSKILRERGWLEALKEDFLALTDPNRYRLNPQELWRRIRNKTRFSREKQVVLRALAAWREEKASYYNRPRRWIIDDTVLIDLAHRLPETLVDLYSIHGLSNIIYQSYGIALLDQIATARREPPESWPMQASDYRHHLSRKQAVLVDDLLNLVAVRVHRYNIKPHDIADRCDIECLVSGGDSKILHGWRRTLIGKELSTWL